jgi:hypothetical protein
MPASRPHAPCTMPLFLQLTYQLLQDNNPVLKPTLIVGRQQGTWSREGAVKLTPCNIFNNFNNFNNFAKPCTSKHGP